jgi:4-hydroxy-tetrahydrodipicolinate reductase
VTIKVAVVGATGRMGKLALDLIDAAQDLSLHAAIDSKSELNEALGADVIFEVTKLEVSERVVNFALINNMKIVVGTSGWSAAKLATLEHDLAGTSAGVLVIPNFSIGSMLASSFAAQAAKFFNSIEIVEAHHAGKIDSPSGTAVRTAEMIASARHHLPAALVPGAGQTARGEIVAGIPIHSLRIAGVSAKQDVLFGGSSELLTISHETTSVQAYAYGILLSLRVASQTSGLLVGLQAVVDASTPKG